MSIGDVFAFFGALLALGIALPGLLVAWALLFPNPVAQARIRLEQGPWRCFGLGLLAFALLAVILGRLGAGPGQLLAFAGGSLALALAAVGAAGLASLMGSRLVNGGAPVSPHGALLRGAVALELAAFFPLVGWFVVIPLAAICSLGAAVWALLPRRQRRLAQQPGAQIDSRTTIIPALPIQGYSIPTTAEPLRHEETAERHVVHTP